jgi:hypothetical protein
MTNLPILQIMIWDLARAGKTIRPMPLPDGESSAQTYNDYLALYDQWVKEVILTWKILKQQQSPSSIIETLKGKKPGSDASSNSIS